LLLLRDVLGGSELGGGVLSGLLGRLGWRRRGDGATRFDGWLGRLRSRLVNDLRLLDDGRALLVLRGTCGICQLANLLMDER
jgi:hypothetical protein